MIRGLLLKIWHEVWLMTLLFGCGLLAVCSLLTYVSSDFHEEILEIIERIPFASAMIGAMLGTSLGEKIGAGSFQTLLWVHPTLLAMLWTHAIMAGTRLPAGEIDRGTIDVLLGLPVSRAAAYYSEVIAWLLAGLAILLMGFAGHRLVTAYIPESLRLKLSFDLVVLINLYCMYLAVGAVAFLASSLSNHRSRAIATTFAIVVTSYLLSFLAQFWEPAGQVACLGLMEYYRPAQIMQSGGFPTADVVVLLSIGATAIMLGGEVVARRSICTV